MTVAILLSLSAVAGCNAATPASEAQQRVYASPESQTEKDKPDASGATRTDPAAQHAASKTTATPSSLIDDPADSCDCCTGSCSGAATGGGDGNGGGGEDGDEITDSSIGGSAERLSGIIIIDEVLDPDYSPKSISLTAIDPQSGNTVGRRVFLGTGEFRIAPNTAISGADPAQLYATSPFVNRYHFDRHYTRVAAERYVREEGATHVGWVYDVNLFYDVTLALYGKPSGFSDPLSYKSPFFGPDGGFYFFSEDFTRLWRVDCDNVSMDTLSECDISGLDTNAIVIWPSGEFGSLDDSAGTSVQNTRTDLYFPYVALYPGEGSLMRLSDWLDESSAVYYGASEGNASNIYLLTASPESAKLDMDTYFESSTRQMLPGNSRANTTPVCSPDGGSVAFISRIGTTDSLFIVPADGGEPEELVTDFPFEANVVTGEAEYKGYALLDWR